MDIREAIRNRHSVRDYTDRRIEDAVRAELQAHIDAYNRESGLHIQLLTDEPDAFGGFLAHYGKFNNVKNYLALVGEKTPDLEEKAGYYGERIALAAQMLGLNTCWVALTFRKRKGRYVIGPGEKLVCVLSLGYGATQGKPHRSKPIEAVSNVEGPMPDWFREGIEAALLAPTATNQQKFMITLRNDRVTAKATGGFYSNVDLGIVKYHFEIGAGTENFVWE